MLNPRPQMTFLCWKYTGNVGIVIWEGNHFFPSHLSIRFEQAMKVTDLCSTGKIHTNQQEQGMWKGYFVATIDDDIIHILSSCKFSKIPPLCSHIVQYSIIMGQLLHEHSMLPLIVMLNLVRWSQFAKCDKNYDKIHHSKRGKKPLHVGIRCQR